MKTKVLTLLLLIFLAAFPVMAQTQSHYVTLTWTDTANPTGTQYNVYRLTGTCPVTPPTLSSLEGFTVLNATPLTVLTYKDSAVTGGTSYCYFTTAVSGTNQSAPSNTVPGTVPTLFAPFIQVTVSQ